MRTLLFLLCLTGGTFCVNAQTTSAEEHFQKFIYYAEPTGLVFIEPLQPGMTLYSLSRKYNVSLDSILAANPDLDANAIPLGYPVHIPVFPGAIAFTPPGEEKTAIPLSYRVQPKETLYRISKVYLGVSPDTIMALNPRSEEGLAMGQVVRIGWYMPVDNDYSPVPETPEKVMEISMNPARDFSASYTREGSIMREQKGLAVWKPGKPQALYYVLHASARVGSYMEITNPMLKRTLVAKVTGHIPPGLYPANVGLVVSPSVARALGVLDQQFFAQWRFVE